MVLRQSSPLVWLSHKNPGGKTLLEIAEERDKQNVREPEAPLGFSLGRRGLWIADRIGDLEVSKTASNAIWIPPNESKTLFKPFRQYTKHVELASENGCWKRFRLQRRRGDLTEPPSRTT